jgi:hypothetical protein
VSDYRRAAVRLRIEPAHGGGARIVEAAWNEKQCSAAARNIQETLCVRCRRSIGDGVFVTVSGLLHPEGYYHKACATL